MNDMRLIMENWRTHVETPLREVENADDQVLVEFDLSDVGHITLDALGLVPGYGEVADVANAAWYATKGEYLMAALSVVAMVPVVGDIIGKGGKIATYMTKAGSAGAKKATEHLVKQLQKHMPEITEFLMKLKKNPKIAKHVDSMREALDNYVRTAIENSDYAQTAQGLVDLGKVVATKPVAKVPPSKLGKLKDTAKKIHGAGSHRRKMELAAQNLTGASDEELSDISDEELDNLIPDDMSDDEFAAALGL